MTNVYKKIEGKRFIVTGGAGFIGSHLVDALLKNGAKSVIVIDNLITGKEDNIKHNFSDPRFTFIKADLCSYEVCDKYCRDVDIIFHQAALGSVTRSIENPLLINKINIEGFINVLWAAVQNKVPRIVYASSSSVYGDLNTGERVEEILGTPLSPYSVTKRTNELYAEVFSRLYNLQIIGLRYFNVFGPRQESDSPYAAVIPSFIKAFCNYQRPVIYGDGSQKRDFTYVENVIHANILSAFSELNQRSSYIFNIGTGNSLSIIELFQIIKGLFMIDIEPIYKPPRPGDIYYSSANISKAEKLLGYKPIVSIFDGLQKSIRYFKERKLEEIH